ncbi:MAG: O-antigen ligase family protein [Acidobacteria bacterium]|nr:O-antigen ligase family protein [Acidobacteriota bacterium]
MIRHSGLVLTALLALAVLLAPLPFGGVTPWAESALRALCFLALAVAAVAAEGLSSLRPAAVPAAVLAAFALLGLLQAAALPAGVVAILAPGHAALQRQATGLVPEQGVAPRLTLAAAASRSAALGWAAAAAAFLAAAVAGRQRGQRRALAGAVLAGALFQAFFGTREWFAHTTSLWGVELHNVATSARLRGTFVNPNHLALYLEMALPVAFAWAWWAARRARDTAAVERRLLLLAAPVLIWLLVFACLSLTGSRAGLLAAMGAVTVQGALAAGSRRRWWLAPLGALVALGALALVTAIGVKEGFKRLESTSAADVSLGGRLEEYRAALGLWTRFPVTGSGLGTFRDGFPLVQTASLQGSWWHPHCDFLEVLVTAGVVGAALLAVGLGAVVRQAARVLRAGSRSEDRAAGLAALGVLVSVGLHECLDFGLTMPANTATLAVLLGAATAAKRSATSAQDDRAGQHLALLRADDLQDVEAGAERHRQPQRRRAGRRQHGEGAEAGAVQP